MRESRLVIIACELIDSISLSEHLKLDSVEPRFRASKFSGIVLP